MPARLSNLHRSAFVTGAASGLGRAFAEMLIGDGVKVWGTSRDPGRLQELAALGLSPVRLELSEVDAALAAFEKASDEAGGAFDLFIGNAGFGVFGEFGQADFGPWLAQLEAMIASSFRLTHAAWRQMCSRNRGCLVNISSLAVEFPLPFMSGYNASKAALSALDESLIFESRGKGITVIDFRPGDYRTLFNSNMRSASSGPGSGRPALRRAWSALEANLASAPTPSKAAADLRRAILRGRSGVVRSGSFFQARLAPLLARLAPASAVRAITARYFGC